MILFQEWTKSYPNCLSLNRYRFRITQCLDVIYNQDTDKIIRGI